MSTYSLLLPNELSIKYAWVPDSARANGLHVMGGPGSGKSRLMGKIALQDFLRGRSVVISDPTGGTIDNFLLSLIRLPGRLQEKLWSRVVYIDMSGRDTIVPFPLYYRLTPQESLFTISQRYLEVVRRLDPALENASVEGFNAVYKLGTYIGMILAGLDLQITEAESLIRNPKQWRSRLKEVLEKYPETQPAVEFFYEYMESKPEQRTRRSDSLLTKILAFSADPSMRAMFGTSKPGIDWKLIVSGGYTVLLDFRHELTSERRRFKLLWTYTTLLSFIKNRGFAGRHQPISFIIDEVTQMLGFRTGETSVMSEDIEELISVIARNYGVWLIIAHQSLAQLDQRIQNALMQMGTQIIGFTPNPDDAQYLARQLVPYDPTFVKKNEPVWMNLEQWNESGFSLQYSRPEIIDYRAVEYSPEEQQLLAAQRFQTLGRFQFIVRLPKGEGNINNKLQRLSIDNLDPNFYPDERILAPARHQLAQRSGYSIEAVLAEIQDRQNALNVQNQVKSEPQLAILKVEEQNTDAVPGNTLPTTAAHRSDIDSNDANKTAKAETGSNDDFWR